jgi:ABC-type lipoprotein export system ATPase subunit
VAALKENNFTVSSGDIAVIIGKSGSGKSTLLNIIGGLMPPDIGDVEVGGMSLYSTNETVRARIRTQKIGFIFQSFNLIDELSVINNIRLPFDIAKIKYNKDFEDEIIDKLEIRHRLKFYPDQLSGGERQRVAIARALLMKPDIILADEPTGNLDTESGKSVMDFVRESNELGQTFIIVTHDIEWTKIATVVYRMTDGELKKEG